MKNYKDIIDDIIYYEQNYVVLKGVCDLITNDKYDIKKIKNIHYYFRTGIYSDENYIDDIIKDYDYYAEKSEQDGEYEFNLLLFNEPAEYDSYGRCTHSGGLYIKYSEFKFIRSIKERERDEKLDVLLEDFDLFK